MATHSHAIADTTKPDNIVAAAAKEVGPRWHPNQPGHLQSPWRYHISSSPIWAVHCVSDGVAAEMAPAQVQAVGTDQSWLVLGPTTRTLVRSKCSDSAEHFQSADAAVLPSILFDTHRVVEGRAICVDVVPSAGREWLQAMASPPKPRTFLVAPE